MRLSEQMRLLLDYCRRAENGELHGDSSYYYCETGECKPWSKSTVNALERHGLVRVERYCGDTVFYLFLTDKAWSYWGEDRPDAEAVNAADATRRAIAVGRAPHRIVREEYGINPTYWDGSGWSASVNACKYVNRDKATAALVDVAKAWSLNNLTVEVA